ncbi:MAG: DNA-binding protein YbiB [Burkholderiales bacterium]
METFAAIIKEIGRGERAARDLGFEEARALFGAMLDGGVPDMELGAILLALRFKTEATSELLGFGAALDARIAQLRSPNPRMLPVVIPSYNGARRQSNLMPLLVLLLKRLGVPVLVHGVLESEGRIASPYVFRELGILPQPSVRFAQDALERDGAVFVPVGALSSGLSNLLALKGRLGVRNSAHTLAKLIDPFSADGGGLRVVGVTHPAYADKLRECFAESPGTALLMRGTEGEAFANPRRRPLIELFRDGVSQVLFEAEHGSLKQPPDLPADCDARTTARWIRAALGGEVPVPQPIVNQLAACLYACGHSDSMTAAKAAAVVHSRRGELV